MISRARGLSVWGAILGLLLTLPLYASGYYISLVITILMWSILALSWIIFSGYCGYISLAVAAFFGIGSYMTVLFWPALPLPVLIVMGGLAAMVFALLIGFPCLRIRGPYFVILTLGLSELVKHIVHLYEVRVKGAVGTILVGAPSAEVFYYSLLIIAVMAAAAAYFVKNSKYGLALFSIKGNEAAAEAMGVDTTRYKLLTFGGSAILMGSTGAIMALRWTYIDPTVAFNPLITFQVTIMAILGGWEDFRGPIIGAATLTLISEALGMKYPYHYMAILGIMLILLMKFLPMGLLGAMGEFRALRDATQKGRLKAGAFPSED